MVHLGKIKNYNYFYENELSNNILKKTFEFISLPLSIIFNTSLSTSIYPFNFKKCVEVQYLR